jgi:hypothetical protein
MEGKKKPESGTYTQVPNVFFDTCDLPESAQILYLRLYRHIAYKDEHKFVGSIRKLSNLVRLSKSTVERMVKRLEETRLIYVGSEQSQDQDRDVMTITLNPQELWILNKQHYEENTVPIWDKVMPDAKVLSQIGTICPETGQHTFNLGQSDVNLGQTVPDVSSNSGQVSISTEKERKEEGSKGDDSSIHSSTLSSLSQKANVTAYLRMYMRKFFLEMGVAGKLMDEHLSYLQEIYYASELDKEAFRFKAESTIDKTREAKGDIDYFYDCLCTTLHLKQV